LKEIVMRKNICLILIFAFLLALMATQIADGQSTRPTTQHVPARDWPPMVHFYGEGGRSFGATWSLAQVPRVGETVKLAGLDWEVREVVWAFDASDEGATLLQGDCRVIVRRKTR
jgi:hypothetical protein